MIKKIAIISVTLLSLMSCQSPKIEPIDFKNKKFGIHLKSDLKVGIVSKIEESFHEYIGDISASKISKGNNINTWTTILHATKGIGNNYITITYSKYDKKIHGASYKKSRDTRFSGIKKIVESKHVKRIEESRMQTSIDSLNFESQLLKIYKNDQSIYYNKIHEKKYMNDDILMISITVENSYNLAFSMYFYIVCH